MNKQDIYKMTDEELLIEKKKVNSSKLLNALGIGFLAGIMVFGIVAWALNPNRHFGFLIPMIIPIVLIYRQLKKPNPNNKDLEDLLKQRELN